MTALPTGHDPVPPSGRQHEIAAHGYACVVTEVGASVRELRHEGRDLVVGWPLGDVRPLYRGAVLAPWPNRVTDGAYRWDGVALQLPLTEVERGVALHGLVTWLPWVLAPDEAPGTADDASLTLTCRLHASAGYPFTLDLAVTYSLGADGLTTTLRAVNVGEREAPYGCAPHPYVVAGAGRVDDWVLDLPASRVLDVDAHRLVPTRPPRTRPVDGDLDFRVARRVGGTFVDHAYTHLAGGPAGTTSVRVTDPDGGTGVEVSWDPTVLPWVQVHTADRPEPGNDRVGLAVEPMTCPPDAFGSGEGLVALPPGGSHTASWTLTALP